VESLEASKTLQLLSDFHCPGMRSKPSKEGNPEASLGGGAIEMG
jgi:hypothetical protein